MSAFRRLMSDPLHADVGLLIVRVGVGLSMMVLHGWGKIAGGPERWAGIGGSMANLGITFAPTFWGFMAAFSEFFASALLILGLFFRPAAAMLAFTMLVAALHHLSIPAGEPGSGWNGASHALELLVVYLALAFTGPGRYALIPRTGGSEVLR